VRADIVEVSEFPSLAQQYTVYAVPKTVINDAREVVGALPEAEFVRAVVEAASPPAPAAT
jgi:predicted DsbA family dithiol-disulfide isomerase